MRIARQHRITALTSVLTVEVSTGEGFSVYEIGDWRRPRVEDLDGDGRKEIYILNPGSGTEPASFRALWLSPSP